MSLLISGMNVPTLNEKSGKIKVEKDSCGMSSSYQQP